jgi:hypothetical protein
MRIGGREVQMRCLKVLAEAIKVVTTIVGGAHYFSSHCICLADDPATCLRSRTTEKIEGNMIPSSRIKANVYVSKTTTL